MQIKAEANGFAGGTLISEEATAAFPIRDINTTQHDLLEKVLLQLIATATRKGVLLTQLSARVWVE